LISRGTISVVEPLRDDILSAAAIAFGRCLKGELFLTEDGEGMVEPRPEPLLSEAADCVLPPIGMVRLLIPCDVAEGEPADIGLGMSSSGGVASAAGRSRPRATAII
jgi:hypothetical protein